MTLAITVNNRHTRSVNLDRDKHAADFLNGYIPTSRALRTLEKVSGALVKGVAQRSWSLVGPYGSGKSSFALFVSHLLGLQGDGKRAAFELLGKGNPELRSELESKAADFLVISVVGAPEPLAARLLSAMHVQALEFFSGRKGRNPKILADILEALDSGEVSHADFLRLMRCLKDDLKRCGVAGLVFIIDELGKFLEYEVRHYGANDIYLLQSLAEESSADDTFLLLNFVLLHQSMERYAKGLSETLKNEWGKIQGRFEEIPFLESAEQTLKIVGKVFNNSCSKVDNLKIVEQVNAVIGDESFKDLLPSSLDKAGAESLFKNCYPLHPVTALLLPHLCQKIAQNERTLFSYLGSREDFGVLAMLASLDPGEFVLPHHAFDYFVHNQSLATADFITQKRWAEVLSCLDRASDLREDEINLLKTIGLFNIIGVKGSLKASDGLLNISSLLGNKTYNKVLRKLKSQSLVSFQKFSGEYRVWQGSDFDLDQAISEELGSLGQFPVADELNRSDRLLPVVAKRYSIENSALRYFRPVFVDAKSYLKAPQESKDPRLIFFLSYGTDDSRTFPLIHKFFSSSDILIECSTSDYIRSAVGEVIALRRIGSSSHELERDPVAKKEFQDRLTSAEKVEEAVLSEFLQEPQVHRWEFRGELLAVNQKKDLQQRLSECLQKIYPYAPTFKNELINRDRPSGQAVMARNKLMAAMLSHSDEVDLGFSSASFPAEKAMYRALFRETGIHIVPDEIGATCFLQKPADDSSEGVKPVWERIERFIESTDSEPKSLVELNEELMMPPYGVKAGVLPLLYFAVYLVNQSSIGVFENRRFRPRFTVEMAERFAKRPDEFTFQYFKIEGLNESIFNSYEKAFGLTNQAKKKSSQKSVLDLVKPLASFMGNLPEYVQVTREGLSDRAQKVRSAFNMAKSPNDLIFFNLPGALGFSGTSKLKHEELEEFSVALMGVIKEFSRCHPQMVDRFREALNKGLGREAEISLAETRRTCGNLYGLDQYSADTIGISAFIARLTKVQANNDEWFENVLMFLGRKPSQKWSDNDFNSAMYRLRDYLRQINDLEKIRLETRGSDINDPNIDFYLLKALRKGDSPIEKVVVLDSLVEEKIAVSLSKITAEIMLMDEDLRAACLARLLSQTLAPDLTEKDEEGGVEYKAAKGDIDE